MNGTLKNQIEKNLALVFSDFKNEKEALAFLRSFLSEKELENLSKRLSVSYYLTKKRSHENIKNNLKVSSTTIADAKNLIDKMAIKYALKKLDANEWAEKWARRLKKL